MTKFLTVFDSTQFMPHESYFSWTPSILWTLVISDFLIAMAYFSIPVAIIYFTKKRKDLSAGFTWTLKLFALFILLCGSTHLAEIYTIWIPDYFLEGLIKAATAVTAVATAIVLWPLIPHALKIPAPQEIEAKNLQLSILNSELEEKVERKTRDSRLLAAIVNYSQDAIIGMSVDGIITSWNSKAEKMYGYQADEVLGQSIDIIIPKELRDAAHEILCKLNNNEKVESFETTRITKFGETVDVWVSAAAIKDENDRVVAVSKSDRDITEKKRLERELTRSSRAKDDFLAHVTHDLRSPLNVIIGYLEILDQFEPKSDEYQNAIRAIQRSANMQLKQIDELLDMSRAITGKLSLNVGTFKIEDICDNAIESVQFAAKAKDILLELHIEEKQEFIVCDELRLHQVLWNLLANAIKFTPKGGKVSLSVNRVGTDVAFVVHDSGIGISEHDLPFVFDRHWQKTEQRFRKSERGLGLGLFIAKHIVEAHGGKILAESKALGQGSKFSIFLPVRAMQIEASRPATRTFGSKMLSGFDILLVDDTADALELVQYVLKSVGANVFPASSGAEGISVLKERKVDLIISDIQMPEMDGISFLQEVRRIEKNENIKRRPAIALTAFNGKTEKELVFQAGFQMHLVKPAKREQLLSMVIEAAKMQI